VCDAAPVNGSWLARLCFRAAGPVPKLGSSLVGRPRVPLMPGGAGARRGAGRQIMVAGRIRTCFSDRRGLTLPVPDAWGGPKTLRERLASSIEIAVSWYKT
jgi:hypothetical protein